MTRQDKRTLLLAVLALCLFVVAFGGGLFVGMTIAPQIATTTTEPTREITADTFEVIRVIDGDTFVVEYDGEQTSVRMFGIDAPERGEPGHDEATDALRELVGGRTVTLTFPGKKKRDNFGRLLCRVVVDDVDVGEVMLERGVARPYR